MAVYINTLNGGDIIVGSSGGASPAGNPKTVITFDDGVQEFDWTGELNMDKIIATGLYD